MYVPPRGASRFVHKLTKTKPITRLAARAPIDDSLGMLAQITECRPSVVVRGRAGQIKKDA